ncbi:MAG: hypothetical protein AB1393_02595 [Candidatus Edwardsbacteria bacterium]
MIRHWLLKNWLKRFRHLPIISFSKTLIVPKAVLIRPSNVPGDFLFSLPALKSLRKHYRNAWLSLLVHRRLLPLLENNAIVNELVSYDDEETIPFSKKFSQLKKQLTERKFDLFIDLNYNETKDGLYLLPLLSGCQVRAGYWGKEGAPFFNLEIKLPPLEINEVERNLKFINCLGIETKDRKIVWAPPTEEKKLAQEYLFFEEGKRREKLVFVDFYQLGKNRRLKRFLQYLELKHKVRFVFPFSRFIRKEIDYFCAALRHEPILPSEHTILELAEIIANCDLFISAKSDLFQLAYLLDIPMITIVENEQVWFPQPKPSFRLIKTRSIRRLKLKEICAFADAFLSLNIRNQISKLQTKI